MRTSKKIMPKSDIHKGSFPVEETLAKVADMLTEEGRALLASVDPNELEDEERREAAEREQELSLAGATVRLTGDSGMSRERRLLSMMFAAVAHFHIDPSERARELDWFIADLHDRSHPDAGQEWFEECRRLVVGDGEFE